MKATDDKSFMAIVASGGGDHDEKQDKHANQEKQTPSPKSKKKKLAKQLELEFMELFMMRGTEGDKCTVYLNKNTVHQIKNIVAILGGGKATLGSYVEAIIQAHFEQYKDEIIKLFNENLKQPFE